MNVTSLKADASSFLSRASLYPPSSSVAYAEKSTDEASLPRLNFPYAFLQLGDDKTNAPTPINEPGGTPSYLPPPPPSPPSSPEDEYPPPSFRPPPPPYPNPPPYPGSAAAAEELGAVGGVEPEAPFGAPEAAAEGGLPLPRERPGRVPWEVRGAAGAEEATRASREGPRRRESRRGFRGRGIRESQLQTIEEEAPGTYTPPRPGVEWIAQGALESPEEGPSGGGPPPERPVGPPVVVRRRSLRERLRRRKPRRNKEEFILLLAEKLDFHPSVWLRKLAEVKRQGGSVNTLAAAMLAQKENRPNITTSLKVRAAALYTKYKLTGRLQ